MDGPKKESIWVCRDSKGRETHLLLGLQLPHTTEEEGQRNDSRMARTRRDSEDDEEEEEVEEEGATTDWMREKQR